LSHRHLCLHNQFIELISFIDLTNLRAIACRQDF
jgi:hypothetical protein